MNLGFSLLFLVHLIYFFLYPFIDGFAIYYAYIPICNPYNSSYRHTIGLLGHIRLSNYSEKQMGRQHVSPSHHITEREDGRFDVNICRLCSNSDNTLFLGTFDSFEDAMIVNEVHELIFDRFSSLCIVLSLCVCVLCCVFHFPCSCFF